MKRRTFPRTSAARATGVRQHGGTRRRGTVVVLAALLLIGVMGIMALSIDSGYMYSMQGELQRSVDAAALAGAGELIEGQDSVQSRVVEYLVRNPVGAGGGATVNENQLDQAMAQFSTEHGNELTVQIGRWHPNDYDPMSGQLGYFEETGEMPSAVSVDMAYRELPLFFAAALGQSEFDVQSRAIATYQPRDILLVLDLSGSMNDDSELKSINAVGREQVEANLLQIYEDLEEPTYGTMAFDPEYVTVVGDPPSAGNQPQITVEYRHKSVYITSTKDLSNVVLRGSNGNEQKFEGLSGTSGVFARSDNRAIYKVWVKSGSNASGEGPGYGEPFNFHPDTINETIKTALGLDSVSYPYPSGSWNSYIDYCKSYYASNANAGYRYKFGYMNLINYWLEKKPMHSQTPDLYKVSAQPITAVKDAVDVFMDYMREVRTNDRVGLAVYNSSSGNGTVECELTDDLDSVADVAWLRQAGHYHTYTNIGGGMEAARAELEANGRQNAFKMMVVLTDGKANWVNGQYNISVAEQYVLDEAAAAAGLKYPIVTVSLGAGADTSLMQQVADITTGIHFNVPGGQTVAQYTADLRETFQKIAARRPLRVVR